MPVESLEEHERRDRLEAKLRLLSAPHRAVLVLRDIEGLTYEEISAVTETPLKGRLHRARGASILERAGETLGDFLPQLAGAVALLLIGL